MTDRLLNACGQIGVSTQARAFGNRIGPPALNEYAVEPVGVAKIMPSQTYSVNNSPSMVTRNRTIRENAPREITASLRAGWLSCFLPARESVGCRANRSLIWY